MKIDIDIERGYIEIEGIKYDLALFSGLAFAGNVGRTFKILTTGSGVVTLERVDESGRITELLEFNNQFEERARVAERAIKTLTTMRPASEYHEDYGDVLWWKLPIEEPPYCGSPNDIGITVEAHTTTRIITQMDQEHDPEPVIHRINAGGWPGYHTHWTPLPIPKVR